jgi:hypothetical protein
LIEDMTSVGGIARSTADLFLSYIKMARLACGKSPLGEQGWDDYPFA